MLTERLMRLTIAGGSEWVMVVLLILSGISLAVIAERAIVLFLRGRKLQQIDAYLAPRLVAARGEELDRYIELTKDPTLVAALVGREQADAAAAERMVASNLGRERLRLQRRLPFLGTLGSNAPFIGLFGTVLGIIRAFHDLSLGDKKGASAVMGGISEALVATAVGLFVAIPAVMAYNYFQQRVDRTLSITEALAQELLSQDPKRCNTAGHTGNNDSNPEQD
jgi:biopolymer transport protein ExbB